VAASVVAGIAVGVGLQTTGPLAALPLLLLVALLVGAAQQTLP
jgi:hypothetical protein